jgi:TfoX/Sxy family transcriptional regulator of competence genes
MHMPKTPDELTARFASATEAIPGLERRKMFGYPAGFVGGNMVTGLHGMSWHVRLPKEEQTELLAAGGTQFAPMPGRPMTGYIVLPQPIVDDERALRTWLDRAVACGRTLPEKAGRRK